MREHLESRPQSSDRSRVIFGVDQPRPDVCSQHYVAPRKMRRFQDLRQTIVIIGDWIVQIGVPTGRLAWRAKLAATTSDQNAQTYFDQLMMVIAVERASCILVWCGFRGVWRSW